MQKLSKTQLELHKELMIIRRKGEARLAQVLASRLERGLEGPKWRLSLYERAAYLGVYPDGENIGNYSSSYSSTIKGLSLRAYNALRKHGLVAVVQGVWIAKVSKNEPLEYRLLWDSIAQNTATTTKKG